MNKTIAITFTSILLSATAFACQSRNVVLPQETIIPVVAATEFSTSLSLPQTTQLETSQNQPTFTLQPSLAPTPTFISITSTPTPDTRQTPKYWREWPVVPELSLRASDILKKGVEAGNNIHSFSRIGDCQGTPDVFLGIYATDRYILPADQPGLPDTIDFFASSFERNNVTAKDGFGVSNVLSNLFANPDLCHSGETPLDCELRRSEPIVAFIAMGTNWQPNSSAKFEQYLREIVDILIEHGTLPVIVTKADNIEGDWMLNLSMAKVAYDYDLPLVNAWRSVQYLPNHGLEDNRIYMAPPAWDERNLATLSTLDAIRKEILQSSTK